jgi:hypothetical protein
LAIVKITHFGFDLIVLVDKKLFLMTEKVSIDPLQRCLRGYQQTPCQYHSIQDILIGCVSVSQPLQIKLGQGFDEDNPLNKNG